MSDDEEVKRGGLNGQEDAEKDGAKNSSSDDDDSSSSSSSGSSSDSSSSDSESDGEDNEEKSKENASETPGEGNQAFGQDGLHYSATAAARKHSSDGQSHAHGFSKSALAQATAAEMNVNSNRAAARFREQNPAQAMGMMALGTKKRDRRTIEEIQRDLQLKRGKKPTGSGLSGANGGLAARSSPPPRGSPVRSPDSGGSGGGDPATVMAQQLGYGGVGGAARNLPKKPVSARDRLEIRLKGRRGNASANTAVGKGRKGVNGGPSTGSAAGTGSGGGVGGMVTNISAGKVVKPMGGDSAFGDTHTELTSSSSGGGNLALTSQAPSAPAKMEPKIEPRVAEVRPDGRVVRALLRGMLRYGDLTDVQMFSRTSSFADEYKQPNFIERSNLQSSTKMTMERLLKLATDIAERAQSAVENKQDSMKFYEVEIKPSQVIERLYENLKLRVAVQRALRDTNCPKNGTNGAYVLIAKQCDLPMLGIPRDFPPWSWAEKEHDWTSRKDAALLLGIYVHGFGGWEDILNDDLLHFQQQRALKGERMKKRAENLLKRLPSPDESGEPKFVNAATVLASGPQNPGQSLGAQFSAIIHNNGGNKGNGPVVVASASAASGGGRMQRAAERAAARQQAGVGNSSVIPEDSIRRMHPQLSNGSQTGRYRKSSAASSLNGNDEPEDGEVDNERRERSGSNSRSTSRANSPIDKSSSSAAPRRSSSSTSSKRSASLELEDSGNEVSLKRRKGSEGGSRKHGVQSTASRRRLLSEDECYDKWKPNKKLKDIRQVLKKMKIMTQWSKNQKDQVVVEKVFKYITTIGDAIDKIVRKARVDEGEQNGGRANSDERDADRPSDSHEWDELCSCLWTYAAEYTPFSSRTFEQLYDDICADGEVLRAQRQPTPTRSTSKVTAASIAGKRQVASKQRAKMMQMMPPPTPDELALKDQVTETLAQQGVLAKIKAELRAAVFRVMHDRALPEETSSGPKLGEFPDKVTTTALELIVDCMSFFQWDHSLLVLRAEADIESTPLPVECAELAEKLNLRAPGKNAASAMPLLLQLVEERLSKQSTLKFDSTAAVTSHKLEPREEISSSADRYAEPPAPARLESSLTRALPSAQSDEEVKREDDQDEKSDEERSVDSQPSFDRLEMTPVSDTKMPAPVDDSGDRYERSLVAQVVTTVKVDEKVIESAASEDGNDDDFEELEESMAEDIASTSELDESGYSSPEPQLTRTRAKDEDDRTEEAAFSAPVQPTATQAPQQHHDDNDDDMAEHSASAEDAEPLAPPPVPTRLTPPKSMDAPTTQKRKDQHDDLNEDDFDPDLEAERLSSLDAKLKAMEAEDDTGTLQQLKASLQMELQHAESSMRSDKSGRSSEQGGGDDDDGYGSSDFEEEEEIASDISEQVESMAEESMAAESEQAEDDRSDVNGGKEAIAAAVPAVLQDDRAVESEDALNGYDYIEDVERGW